MNGSRSLFGTWQKPVFGETASTSTDNVQTMYITTLNSSFQELFLYAQSAPNISHILLPSANTARSWMTEAFTSGMEEMIEEFKRQPSICYITDLWTSDWMDSYMCITAHWIDNEWNRRQVVIGFEFITGLDTGRENTIVETDF
jgi:hypothetical protein